MEIVIGVVVLIVLAALFSKPSSCTVCDTSIKRTYYKWRLDGKKHFLCPNCNRSMERKQSREAMKDFE